MFGGGGEARVLYHGTSLEAILSIQESGFRIDLSGTNAGAALGPGVYVTTTLQKALNYAKREGIPGKEPNPAAGGVFELEVDLGRCCTVRSAAGPRKATRAERTSWASQGYDSAWAAAGVIGEMEENCVRDPARIRITNLVLGNTGEARRLGYEVRNGRLEVSAAFLQEQQRRLLEAAQASEAQAREEAAAMRRERDAALLQAQQDREAMQEALDAAVRQVAEPQRLNDQILRTSPGGGGGGVARPQEVPRAGSTTWACCSGRPKRLPDAQPSALGGRLATAPVAAAAAVSPVRDAPGSSMAGGASPRAVAALCWARAHADLDIRGEGGALAKRTQYSGCWRTALCGEAMEAEGDHYAEFTLVATKCGGDMVGVARPTYDPAQGDVRYGVCSTANGWMLFCFDGKHCHASGNGEAWASGGPLKVAAGETVGLLLSRGRLSVYRKGSAVGVLCEGLSGSLVWAADLRHQGDAVRIARGAVPAAR
jgi:hypothetical protein